MSYTVDLTDRFHISVRVLWRWIYEMLRHQYARLWGGDDGGLRYLTYKTRQCSYGKSPLEIVQTMRSRAGEPWTFLCIIANTKVSFTGIGDCDYNLHLSNSSYGKASDFFDQIAPSLMMFLIRI